MYEIHTHDKDILVWLTFLCLFADLVIRVAENLQRTFINHFGHMYTNYYH